MAIILLMVTKLFSFGGVAAWVDDAKIISSLIINYTEFAENQLFHTRHSKENTVIEKL